MISLDCYAQTYAWGKVGSESAVAQIKGSANKSTFVFDEAQHYAELWMGTHPSGPARVEGPSNELLLEYIHRHAESVGLVPPSYPHNDLPFLFKVLSIKTALSVQAHPDKALAEDLHQRFPLVYKDDNHKPEMAIALTPFEAMNGFRPRAEIQEHLSPLTKQGQPNPQYYPELRELVGEEVAARFLLLPPQILTTQVPGPNTPFTHTKGESGEWLCLKALMEAFLTCPEERASACVSALINRLERQRLEREASTPSEHTVSDGVMLKEEYLPTLIRRLHADYPGDRGIFMPLLLNCMQMQVGQAFFMAANEPHAYIAGDIIECMALSDNVVRAGLTPKFKDIEVLVEMLNYHSTFPSFQVPLHMDEYTLRYRPPIPEFEVEVTTLPAGVDQHVLSTQPCAAIILFFKGAGYEYSFVRGGEGALPSPPPSSSSSSSSSSSGSSSSSPSSSAETETVAAAGGEGAGGRRGGGGVAAAVEQGQYLPLVEGTCFYVHAHTTITIRVVGGGGGGGGFSLYRAHVNLDSDPNNFITNPQWV